MFTSVSIASVPNLEVYIGNWRSEATFKAAWSLIKSITPDIKTIVITFAENSLKGWLSSDTIARWPELVGVLNWLWPDVTVSFRESVRWSPMMRYDPLAELHDKEERMTLTEGTPLYPARHDSPIRVIQRKCRPVIRGYLTTVLEHANKGVKIDI